MAFALASTLMNRAMSIVLRFFVAGFLLNFLWESWHAVYLYNGFDFILPVHVASLPEFVQMMTQVALKDALLLVAVLGVGCGLFADLRAGQRLAWRTRAYVIGATLLIAIAIEYKAIYLWQQWSYTAAMPTVWGLGVSPLLQLPLTWFGAWWLSQGRS